MTRENIVLDLQEHFNAIHKASADSKEFYDLVNDVRHSDRNLDKHINNVLKSVQAIMETLKVNQNTLIEEYEQSGSKYQIFINNKGLRHKNDWYHNTDPMRSNTFKEKFNSELLDKVFKALKPFQQDRIKLLMDIKEEFNTFKELATTTKELKFDIFDLIHFDGSHFATEAIKSILLPDVASKSGWHGELSNYQLIQMKSFLTPQLILYQEEHKIKMDSLVTLNAKIKAAYPLLFMFNGGLSGE